MSFHAMNRRTFLETATTAAAATLLTSRLGWAAGEHKIEKVGVQLYTVRDQMKADFDGTIAKVAQIGYKEVEFAGYFGRTPSRSAPLAKRMVSLRSPPMCNTTNSTTNSPPSSKLRNHRLEIHCLPLDSRGTAQVSRHLEAGRRKIQPLRRADQESRHAVRLSQSLVRISSRQRQASLRRTAQRCATPIW